MEYVNMANGPKVYYVESVPYDRWFRFPGQTRRYQLVDTHDAEVSRSKPLAVRSETGSLTWVEWGTIVELV